MSGVCECGHDKALHTWEYDDLCSGSGSTKYGCGCHAFRPAAEPAPPTDGLREEIGLAAHTALGGHGGDCPCGQAGRLDCDDVADAVLALPGIQRLIAAEEAVRRVRKIHVPSHGYCVACDRDRDVEALGNNPACPHDTSFCRACDYAWPCQAMRALDGD